MSKIFLLGECMIELMPSPSNTFKQSFAGDIFNTAVYLKRSFSQTQVHLITAIGKDKFSLEMREHFHREHIESSFVFQSDNKIPGLYAIQTDETGERSFTYWREDSAARQVMQYLNNEVIKQISQADMFFFSGISLAILPQEDRENFWRFIEKLKAAKVQVVFDPNYRAALWASPEQAKQQFELAFEYADITLPGVDDFQELYGLTTAEQVADYLYPYALKELLIKNGGKELLWLGDNQRHFVTIKPVDKVVDATSAGDAFNGVYLGARLQGLPAHQSIALASKAAAFVIQHPGAIVPQSTFKIFIEELTSSPHSR